jgi:hypothetical protein
MEKNLRLQLSWATLWAEFYIQSYGLKFLNHLNNAVIFAAQRTKFDRGYGIMANKMVALASRQKGFLLVVSTRDYGLEITYT